MHLKVIDFMLGEFYLNRKIEKAIIPVTLMMVIMLVMTRH